MIKIDENRMLSLFKKLVETDSPTGAEREICDVIKKELEKSDIIFEEDSAGERIGGTAGNLYAYIDGDLNLPPILFCAHMDTVEPSCNKRFIEEPDGTLHSDGTTVLGADDFAGISSIVEAIRTVKENDLSHRPIELLFSVSEEVYCKGISKFDFGKLKSKEAYIFDLDGKVGTAAYAAPTILSFKADIKGRPSHAGFAPEQGIHSVKAASNAVSKIYCGKIDADTTVNIGTICGGTANNIVPETCTLTGEIRSYSDDKALEQYELIASIIEQSSNELGATANVSFTRNITAYETDLNHQVIKRFQKACSSLKLNSKLIKSFGGSDNNVFSQNGIAGLVTATGMNACHTKAEWTTIYELKNAAYLALNLMISKE